MRRDLLTFTSMCIEVVPRTSAVWREHTVFETSVGLLMSKWRKVEELQVHSPPVSSQWRIASIRELTHGGHVFGVLSLPW